MYAVVTTGSRQYRVSPGDRIDVEKLTGAVGDTVALTNVLLVGQGAEVTIGAPDVAGVRVEDQITAQKRGKKIIIFKHRRRKGYRRKQSVAPDVSSEEQGIAPGVSPEQSIEPNQTPPLSGESIA